MKPVYAIGLLLLGAVLTGGGVLMILLASSAGGSISVIWSIFLHAVAFMWPTLCNGYSMVDRGDDTFGSSYGGGMADVNDVVAKRTRVWVFVIVSLLIVCQGWAIWTAASVYGDPSLDVSKVDTWPGTALSLCVFMQALAGVMFFAAR